MQRGLARARDAGEAGEHAQRNAHFDVLEVVLARAAHRQERPIARPARRDRDDASARQVVAGDRPRRWPACPRSYPPPPPRPPCSPAPGPMSMIQSAVRIVSSSCSTTMIVLPRSRRSQQRARAAAVVSLMQADARLVQDVEHAHQPGPDLCRQPDALRLSPGQRRRRAVEREVVEPDVEQEARGASWISFSTCRAICSSLAYGQSSASVGRRTPSPGGWTGPPPPRCSCSPTVTARLSGFSRVPLAGAAGLHRGEGVEVVALRCPTRLPRTPAAGSA